MFYKSQPCQDMAHVHYRHGQEAHLGKNVPEGFMACPYYHDASDMRQVALTARYANQNQSNVPKNDFYGG